jgi:ESX secretion system ATPase EccB
MPSTPTTKSQVQAYRFVLRRMQSALVRKDAVMLHDPMRTHSRATIVGVCLAALGMLGFLIWGILSPKGQAPTEDGIVIGKPSGQVYVMIAKPKKLIPVFNLASARLVLMAREQEKAAEQAGQSGQQQAAAGEAKVVDPDVVDDNELRDIPRGRKMGIPNGPDLLPGKDQRIDANWAVCDTYQLDESKPGEDVDKGDVKTTVIAGQKDLGEQLPENGALLVKLAEKPDEAWLVYRTPSDLNNKNTLTVRAKIDQSNSAVALALRTTNADPRTISLGLLNAIPPERDLAVPKISNIGDDSDAKDADGKPLPIGDVYQVKPPGSPTTYYVVQKAGLEQIRGTTAGMLRATNANGSTNVPVLAEDDAAAALSANRDVDQIEDDTFPNEAPETVEPLSTPVACLGWKTIGSGNNIDQQTTVYVGKQLPGLKVDDKGNPTEAVKISTPNAKDIRIDYFYMRGGHAAIVRQASSKAQFDTGSIILVSDRGVKYGIPDARTAQGLGLEEQKPAPASIIGLLPDGDELSPDNANQNFDTAPAPKGDRNPPDDGG